MPDDESREVDPEVALAEAMAAISLPTELPPPHAPACRKRDLYYDASVFQELDEDVFKVSAISQLSIIFIFYYFRLEIY